MSPPNKIDVLANMTGLPEAAASEAAEAEVDAAMGREADLDVDPFDPKAEGNKAARKDERRRDVIHTKSEDYDDQDDERPVVKKEDDSEGEEDLEDDDDQIEDPIKLRKMLQKSRRAHRKIVKKLSKVEGAALASMAQVVEQPQETANVTTAPDNLLADLGIEDPDAPLSGAELVKIMGKMNAQQSQNLRAQSEHTRKVDSFQVRVEKSEEKMRQEVEDYDKVVGPHYGLMNAKGPDYDEGLARFLSTRIDPAKTFYDMIVQATGGVSSDDLDEDDLGEEEVDERTLKALRKRDKKQRTLTMSRTPETGRTQKRKRNRLTETLGVFQQIQDMDDEELDRFTIKHGGEPY